MQHPFHSCTITATDCMQRRRKWAPCRRLFRRLEFLYVFKPSFLIPTQFSHKDLFHISGLPWQVYLYANRSEVEPEALQQLISLAESPLPVGYVSAMPDVHVGKGVTVSILPMLLLRMESVCIAMQTMQSREPTCCLVVLRSRLAPCLRPRSMWHRWLWALISVSIVPLSKTLLSTGAVTMPIAAGARLWHVRCALRWAARGHVVHEAAGKDAGAHQRRHTNRWSPWIAEACISVAAAPAGSSGQFAPERSACTAGFAQHSKPLDGATRALQDISDRKAPSDYLAEAVTSPKAAHQLGTLGGGNHFLEVTALYHGLSMHRLFHPVLLSCYLNTSRRYQHCLQ